MRKVIAFLLMALSVLSLSADELSIKYDKESLYTKMLVNNTSLRNAERDIYEAHLDTKDAKANYSPDIDLTVSGTYMTEPIVGNITVSTDELLSSSGIPTSTGGYVTLFDGMDNTLYNASLTVTQPINTWGKINLAAKLYETVEGIQGMKKTDLERQLSAELSIRLYLLCYLDQISALISEAESYADELISIAEVSFKNGVIIEADYIDAKIQRMDLEVRKSELNSQIEANLQALRTLTGITNLKKDEILFEPEDSILYVYKDYDYQALRELALSSSNISLQMVNSLKAVHSLQEKIANRSMYGIPDMALQVGATYSTPRVPGLEAGWRQNDNFSLNFTFAMQTTLWDGGDKINDKRRAESSIIRDEISYDEAVLSIDKVLSENYNQMINNLIKLDYLNLSNNSIGLGIKNTELAAKEGQKGRMDLLTSYLKRVENEIEGLMTKAGLSSNVFMISYLIGDDI